MANKRISELESLTVVTGSEELPIVHDGANYKTTLSNLTRNITAASIGAIPSSTLSSLATNDSVSTAISSITPASLGVYTTVQTNQAIAAIVGAAPAALSTLKAIDDQLKADENNAANIVSNITNEVTRAQTAETTLTTNLASEVTRAKAAETDIVTSMAAEVTRAQAAESILTDSITNEIKRAKSAELDGFSNLITESNRAQAAELALNNTITAEISRAEKVEKSLNDSITAEVTRAESFEESLGVSIANEVTRATTEEQHLQSEIDAATARAKAAENAVSLSIDSETTRAQTAESGLATTITTAVTNEQQRAVSAESAINVSLNNEISRAKTVEAAISTALSTENTRAVKAEVDLQSQLNAIDTGKLGAATVNNPTFTGVMTVPNVIVTGINPNSALYLDANNEIASSPTTATELGYVHGVTSAIQTQLNALAPSANPNFTGTVNVAGPANFHGNVTGITAGMVGLSGFTGLTPDTLPIPVSVNTALGGKQATLISGSNIKTLNNIDLLGTGDIPVKTVGNQNIFGTGDIAIPILKADLGIESNITGLLKGNGSILEPAVAGTDYQLPITSTSNFIKTIANNSLVGPGDLSVKTIYGHSFFGVGDLAPEINLNTPTNISGILAGHNGQIIAAVSGSDFQAPLVTGTLTSGTIPTTTVNGMLTSSTTTATKLAYINNVTSDIQTQIDSKQATVTGAASTIVSSNLTANVVVVSDANGKAANSTISTTLLGYLSGLTGNIENQLTSLSTAISSVNSSLSNYVPASTLSSLATNSSVSNAIAAITPVSIGAISSSQINNFATTASVSNITASSIGAISTTAISTLATNSSVSNAIAAITPASIGAISSSSLAATLGNYALIAGQVFTGNISAPKVSDNNGSLRTTPLTTSTTITASSSGQRLMVTSDVVIPGGAFSGGEDILISNTSTSSIHITGSNGMSLYLDGSTTASSSITLVAYGTCGVCINSSSQAFVMGKSVS